MLKSDPAQVEVEWKIMWKCGIINSVVDNVILGDICIYYYQYCEQRPLSVCTDIFCIDCCCNVC